MAGLNEQNKKMSADLKLFSDSMQDVAEDVHSLEEENKDIAKLQQKIKSSANQLQNEKDKLTLSKRRKEHLQTATEIKTYLKEELEKLNDEEFGAKREQKVLLDENNEIYIKRTQFEETYKRFLDCWTTFHQNQIDYRDCIKNILSTRIKVVNENANDEEIDMLLDPNKDTNINVILKDARPRKEEAAELENRCSELRELQTFIGETHILLTHVDTLLTSQRERVEEIIEPTEPDYSKYKHFILERKKTFVLISCFILVSIFILILVGVLSSGSPIDTTTEGNSEITTKHETDLEPVIITDRLIDAPPSSND